MEALECQQCFTTDMGAQYPRNERQTYTTHHNVMNADIVAGISDEATDGLNLVFTTDSGKNYLK